MNHSTHRTENQTLSTVSPGILLLRVPQASDRKTCEDFEAAIKGALASRPTMVVVDLSAAQSVSTVVIGMLLSLRRGMVGLGGEVRLAGVQPMVRRVLNICRLDQLFGLYPTPENAIRGLHDAAV